MVQFVPTPLTAAAAFFVVVGTAEAIAQSKTVHGKSGEEIRAAVLGGPRPDCTSAPRPEVRPLSLPQHGILRVSPATLRTSRVKNCPEVEVPVAVVFYKSRPGFTGTDSFTLESKLGATTRTQVIAVHVE